MSFSVFPPAREGIPSGATTSRPASPAIGDTFYNGQTAGLEIYNGTAWVPSSRQWAADDYVPAAPIIGTATTSGTNTNVTVTWTLGGNGGRPLTSITITPLLNGTTPQTSQTASTTSATSHTFTGLATNSSYTFRVRANNANGNGVESAPTNSVTIPNLINVDFLVIAGGGGGGASSVSGGAGAGGYRTSFGTSGANSTAESTFGVTPSSGFTVTVGAGGGTASEGNNSQFSVIQSTGGGRGGSSGSNGVNGGSGGGGTGNGVGGAGTTNQGFAGGSSFTSSSGAGGGGAGAVGGNDGSNQGGTGGTGIASTITGSSVFRAGGGGGRGSSNPGSGGNGGGGSGLGSNGTPNTGGGGGGAGGSGGSGVVILRYPDTRTITIGAGLTGSTSTDGSFRVTTFTAGTGTVSIA